MQPANVSLAFWFAWIAIYAVVYSTTGGIMHYYYLSTLAPALCALAGIGFIGLWRAWATEARTDAKTSRA